MNNAELNYRMTLLGLGTLYLSIFPSNLSKFDHHKIEKYKKAIGDLSRIIKRRDVKTDVLEVAVMNVKKFH